MAATGKFYGLAFQSIFNKEVDFDTDTLKVMLCTSSYTPNQDTHRYKSDVTNELSATGYTAGGKALTTVAYSYNTSTNLFKITADNVTWTSIALADVRYAVVYDSTPATDATRPLIAYIDLGAAQTFTGDATLTWDSTNGVCSVTVA